MTTMKTMATALLASCVLAQAPLLATPTNAVGVAPATEGDAAATTAIQATVRKNFSETYDVDAIGELVLDNRHGDIVYRVTPGNQVSIRVDVEARAGSEKKAQDILDKIDVAIAGSRTRVSAVTNISGRGRKMNSIVVNGRGEDRGFKVDYAVSGPAGFALKLANAFGDVELGDLSARAEIEVSYGDLDAGDLGAGSTVRVSFGDGAVGYAPDVDAEVKYGKLGMRGAERATLVARFSEMELGRFGELEVDAQYGKYTVQSVRDFRSEGGFNGLRVDSAERVTVDGNYNDVKVGFLATSGHFEVGFGDVHISSTSATLEEVDFEGSYTDMTIVMAEGLGYTLDAATSYGKLRYPSGFKASEEASKGMRERVAGEMGNGGGARVTFEGSFGDLVVK